MRSVNSASIHSVLKLHFKFSRPSIKQEKKEKATASRTDKRK